MNSSKVFALTAVLTLCLTTLAVTPPPSFAASSTNQITFFKAQHSGKCLDVNNSSPDNGAKVQQWDCNNTNAQNWELFYVGSGPRFRDQAGNYYALRNVNSKKCLDIYGAATHNGARITQWECHWGGNQQWLLYDHFWTSSHKVTLYNAYSNKCLDVLAYATNRGAEVVIYDCNGGTNQNWYWNGR